MAYVASPNRQQFGGSSSPVKYGGNNHNNGNNNNGNNVAVYGISPPSHANQFMMNDNNGNYSNSAPHSSQAQQQQQQQLQKKSRHRDSRKQHVGSYTIEKTIGEGSYASVKSALHTATNEKVALKIFDKNDIDHEQDELSKIFMEINILKDVDHPNIIQLFDVVETQDEYYLALEYCAGGELFEHIVAHERLPEKETKKYFRQVVDAVDYLHKCNIVHRDLKPENLLLDKNKNIKLIDFGMASYFLEGQTFSQTCGSLAYASPEMLSGKPYTGVDVDIWSLGIILFACLTGYLPFEDPDHSKLQRKIQAGKFSIPYSLSKEVRDLIKRILVVDQKERATMKEIKYHPWLEWESSPEALAETKILAARKCLVSAREKAMLTNTPISLPPLHDSVVNQLISGLNFTRSQISEAVTNRSCNDVYAAYQLLLAKIQKPLISQSSSYSTAFQLWELTSPSSFRQNLSILGNNASVPTIANEKEKEKEKEKEVKEKEVKQKLSSSSTTTTTMEPQKEQTSISSTSTLTLPAKFSDLKKSSNNSNNGNSNNSEGSSSSHNATATTTATTSATIVTSSGVSGFTSAVTSGFNNNSNNNNNNNTSLSTTTSAVTSAVTSASSGQTSSFVTASSGANNNNNNNNNSNINSNNDNNKVTTSSNNFQTTAPTKFASSYSNKENSIRDLAKVLQIQQTEAQYPSRSSQSNNNNNNNTNNNNNNNNNKEKDNNNGKGFSSLFSGMRSSAAVVPMLTNLPSSSINEDSGSGVGNGNNNNNNNSNDNYNNNGVSQYSARSTIHLTSSAASSSSNLSKYQGKGMQPVKLTDYPVKASPRKKDFSNEEAEPLTMGKEIAQALSSKTSWMKTRSKSYTATDEYDDGYFPLSKDITPAPAPLDDRDSQPPLWSTEGSFNANTTSSLPPKVILAKLQSILKENGCKYRSIEPFSLKCEKEEIRFQVDINQLPNLKDLSGIFIKRISGNPWQYKELSNNIFMAFKS